MTVAVVAVAVVLVLAAVVLLVVAFDRSPDGTGDVVAPVTQTPDVSQVTRTAAVGGGWAFGLALLVLLERRADGAPDVEQWLLLAVGFVGFPLMTMAALEASVLVRLYRTQATALRDELHDAKAELKELRQQR